MDDLGAVLDDVRSWLGRVAALDTRCRAGDIRARVPAGLRDDEPLEELARRHLPVSHAALAAADRGLFCSLPVAFDPTHSVGPYLATVDRDAEGEPWRFLDMGAMIATQPFGENDPGIVAALLRDLPCVVSRYAHSEYQTVLSLRLKAALDRIAPAGTPRHFVVNTGAEAVENAIKAVLLNRVRRVRVPGGGFVVSFEGAFHGRTLGGLAVTHRRRARLGFPTFEWPCAAFPALEGSAREIARREERSLQRLWDLLASARHPEPERRREGFRAELAAIDGFLARPGADLERFLRERRAALGEAMLARASRAAAVLIEPIQGEGGVRVAGATFMRRLRLLTRLFDVPLLFDEVQTGWGATGRRWAHEWFDLPCPPDAVVWAKKAQNGVLFVSEELATFFQEEKKFNTTWEGDSTGMIRLLAVLDRLDLDQIARTGSHARAGLQRLADEFPGLLRGVRGAGVMLGFDVSRADWRDALRDRAFRSGLILLPAGERTLRFYPRFDTPPHAIDEAIAILRRAIEELTAGSGVPTATAGPEIRVGALDCPLDTLAVVDLADGRFAEHRAAVLAVEVDRYGGTSRYPADVLRAGTRPLLQFPAETLESTLAGPGAIGVALRDGVSSRIVAYALGSALEEHDEEGVRADPRLGEGVTFYLLAMASLSSVRNRNEVESRLLEEVRGRARRAGYTHLSTLIEERVGATGPHWLRTAEVVRVVDDYLRSGIRFVYLNAALEPEAPARAPGEDRRTAGA